MSRLENAQARALTEESYRRIDDTAVHFDAALGENDVPHVYKTRDGRWFLSVDSLHVKFRLSMSRGQALSIQQQVAVTAVAEGVRPVAS